MHTSSYLGPADFYVVSSTMLLYNVTEAPEVLCIEINITDDTYLEADEYFYLQLNSSDLDVEFKIDHSIVKIQDDDSKYNYTAPLVYYVRAISSDFHGPYNNIGSEFCYEAS